MSVAGLDIGTTGAKITVVNGDGAVVHTGYMDYPVSRGAGAHEVDAGEIWKTVLSLLTQAAAKDGEISAIGVTSFGESFVLTDKVGTPLLPTMLYTDPRGSEEAAQFSETLTNETVFSIAGVTPHPMYTLPKLLWVKRNRPDVFALASYVFLMADYIAFLLTGERRIDVSLAARTMGLDIRRRAWSADIFRAAEIDEKMFSEPVPSGTVAGTLITEVARACGLKKETQVVVCGHDQVTAAIGSGVLQPGCAANGAGTVECVTPVFREIPEDGFLMRDHYPIVPFPGTELYCCYAFSFTGGALLNWFIERFIDELGAKYNIREIAFDRWGAVQMTQNLEELGFTVVPFGQGYKDMSPPTKELMKLTLEKKLAHGGHPVLRWMVDNVAIRTDPAGNIKADKEKSTEKIDGVVATIMALDRAIRHGGRGRVCV